MSSRITCRNVNSMFDAFKPSLEAVGVKPAATWEETKRLTLGQAKAQLARPGIKLETAARWNRRAYICAADMGRDSRLDPRVTAIHRATKLSTALSSTMMRATRE